jgi:hypothetical protein
VAIPEAGRILINVNNMDRLVAGGSVAIATGTVAILFGTLTGPVASILVWIFAMIAIAAFAVLGWSWYPQCLSFITAGRRGAYRRQSTSQRGRTSAQ